MTAKKVLEGKEKRCRDRTKKKGQEKKGTGNARLGDGTREWRKNKPVWEKMKMGSVCPFVGGDEEVFIV